MKILITGGHLTPALGFIDYILSEHPTTKLVFVGREFARVSTKQPAKEQQSMQERGVPFVALESGKITQGSCWYRFGQFFLLIQAFFASLRIIHSQKPDVVVSFGSYLAVPIAYAAWVLRVPVITHEQTRTSGIATQCISYIAHTIAVTFAETRSLFSPSKTVVTGNILRTQVLQHSKQVPNWFTPPSPRKPLLYITGGSQGSEVLNAIVQQALPQLSQNWTLIHQCGLASQSRDYLAELTASIQQLPRSKQKHIFLREWISEAELAWIYTHAAVVVSRAGANTVLEICARQIPAVLIPLPFSNRQEQLKNAQALSEHNQAILLEQKNLTVSSLVAAVSSAYQRKEEFIKRLATFSHPSDAAQQLYKIAVSATKK